MRPNPTDFECEGGYVPHEWYIAYIYSRPARCGNEPRNVYKF